MHKNINTMKIKLLALSLFCFGFLKAQNCDYSSNIKDSIGTYKSTKDYLMSEKFFGSQKKLIYFSLANDNGMPFLNVQFIEKNNDFIKVFCFDKNSKLFLQLENGKIITLMHTTEMNCGTTIKDQQGIKTRINTGYFVFLTGAIEQLKQSPVALIRFRIGSDNSDYIIKTNFKSEQDGELYQPATFFINYLKCIE